MTSANAGRVETRPGYGKRASRCAGAAPSRPQRWSMIVVDSKTLYGETAELSLLSESLDHVLKLAGAGQEIVLTSCVSRLMLWVTDYGDRGRS